MAKKETSAFEDAIKAHLDKVAEQDETFAKNYAKKNKSIKECCQYIIQEVRKKQTGGVGILSDEETYGLAIHYYDEDNIKVDATDTENVKVATPKAEEAKPKAKRGRKPKKAEPKAEQVENNEAEDDDMTLDIPLFD